MSDEITHDIDRKIRDAYGRLTPDAAAQARMRAAVLEVQAAHEEHDGSRTDIYQVKPAMAQITKPRKRHQRMIGALAAVLVVAVVCVGALFTAGGPMLSGSAQKSDTGTVQKAYNAPRNQDADATLQGDSTAARENDEASAGAFNFALAYPVIVLEDGTLLDIVLDGSGSPMHHDAQYGADELKDAVAQSDDASAQVSCKIAKTDERSYVVSYDNGATFYTAVMR